MKKEFDGYLDSDEGQIGYYENDNGTISFEEPFVLEEDAGDLCGFIVLKDIDLVLGIDSDDEENMTLQEESANNLKDLWSKLKEANNVACKGDDTLNARISFHEGERVSFSDYDGFLNDKDLLNLIGYIYDSIKLEYCE